MLPPKTQVETVHYDCSVRFQLLYFVKFNTHVDCLVNLLLYNIRDSYSRHKFWFFLNNPVF
jgi:hypothetical protein